MTSKDIRQEYDRHVNELTLQIQRLKRRGKLLVGGQLVTFMAAIGCVFAYTIQWHTAFLLGALGLLVLYVVIRQYDVHNSQYIAHDESLRQAYSNEVRYLDHDYTAFDEGARYVNPKHAFTYDMDIFGSLSLYQRICRTVTSGGSDYLAQCLGRETGNNDKQHIDQRRDAINKLAEWKEERMEFIATRRHGTIDTDKVKEAIKRVRTLDMPSFATSAWARYLAITLSVAFIIFCLLSFLFSLDSRLAVSWGIIQLVLVFSLCSKYLRNISQAADELEKQITAYAELMKLIASTRLKDCADYKLQALSDGNIHEAQAAFEGLRAVIDGIDRRGNHLGLIIMDTLFLNDFFLVRKFEKWRNTYIDKTEQWIDYMSVMDALVSMATFRYNEPASGNAEIVESNGVEYEAEGIYHPFLGDKAIGNDFTIKNGNYYIVTGANMAGKSTFLRSMGVNYVLAINGMPIFAKRMKVSLFNLFSSMRTSDDLGHNISYFNAELLRLRQLIESCKQARRTLIILDEILKGTNSLDKLNGSRMFLKAIAALPVSGIIATHDLELSRMEEQDPIHFHNWCFEIQLAQSITYTYKLTPGVARNQNATYLLRNIIAEIQDPSPENDKVSARS